MKQKIFTIAIILVFVVGIGIMSYPLVSSMINNSKVDDQVEEYSKLVTDIKSNKEDYSDFFKKAKIYNNSLNSKVIITDPFDEEAYRSIGANYNKVLNVNGKGLMGFVEIPKIDVNLPVYHGTSSKILENYAGHLKNTSMPVGGKGTHAVISAHTGLPDKVFFDNLTDLIKGDIFYMKVLDKTLTYRIDQIKVVLPDETQDLRIIPGEDHVTLLTCTPYGVNTHRLLVRGVRTKYIPADDDSIPIANQTPFEKAFYFMGCKFPYWAVGAVLAGFVLLVVIIVIIIVRKNKKKNSVERKHISDNRKGNKNEKQ